MKKTIIALVACAPLFFSTNLFAANEASAEKVNVINSILAAHSQYKPIKGTQYAYWHRRCARGHCWNTPRYKRGYHRRYNRDYYNHHRYHRGYRW